MINQGNPDTGDCPWAMTISHVRLPARAVSLGDAPARKVPMKVCRPRREGFTLIEVLVVISIITLLIAILQPQLHRAKYEAVMSVCLSNQHQWGNATVAYATDSREALPRQDESFTTGVNTWDVSNRFPTAMAKYGLNDHRLWDCPATPIFPSTVQSWEGALTHFSSAYGYFSITPRNWWVPRQFGAKYFPSLQADPTSDPIGWPTHITSNNGAQAPIMSDRLAKQVALGPSVDGVLFGHRWNNELESTTILFLDAHAERRHVSQIKARYIGNWNNFY